MPLLELIQTTRELFGLELSADQQRAFEQYTQLLVEWNERINLTAITEPLAIEMRHFLDSLSVLRAVQFPPDAHAIDVGTGAGFPGLPLRIVCPTLHMTLLEATGKKTAFLQRVIDALGLTNVNTLNLRAEEAGQLPAHREQYDVVLARAVARMPILAEYLLPLCKIGGRCVALKGETAAAEVHAAERALRLLGGRLDSLVKVELPHVAELHYLVVLEKVAVTPVHYPRKPGTPAKNPL